MVILKALFEAIRALLMAPLLGLFALSSAKDMIRSDVERWCHEVWRCEPGDRYMQRLLALLCAYPEFRSLYYYRLFQGRAPVVLLTQIARVFYPGMPLLFLRKQATVGRGLFIQHGYCTGISADIGDYCWISHQVTLGYVDDTGQRPRLGNHVYVGVGARILGGITLGDRVKVGANAVVLKDVPPNCVVVGVPARIVRRDGVRVDEPL